MDDEQRREQIEQAHQIRQMQESGGWLFLTDVARRKAQIHINRILNGKGAATLHEYHREAGFADGVLWVIERLLPELEQAVRPKP